MPVPAVVAAAAGKTTPEPSAPNQRSHTPSQLHNRGPPLDDDSEWSQAGDPRYADLLETVPRTECLADVVHRMLPYWYDALVPDLRLGRVVLVAAHGNSLRALVKHLDGLSDQEVVGLNIPTGIPLRYELDAQMTPVKTGGEYLDPDAAAESIEAVKDQGR